MAWAEQEGAVPWSGVAESKAPLARHRLPQRAAEPDAYLPWRVHSCFSFRESLLRAEDLADRAVALGLNALALADREGLWGAVPFVEACWARGIKPILGALVPVAAGGHVGLYARNAEGWANLCALLSQALLEAPLAWEALAARSGGLLALGGGDEGPMGLALAAGDAEGALAQALAFKAAVPGWAHLEVPSPDAPWRVLAQASALPAVAAWPWRHHGPEDEDLWRLLRQGHHHRTPARARFHPLGRAEAKGLWAWWPEALALSQSLGEACDFVLPLGQARLPRLPEVVDAQAALRERCEAALPLRYGPEPGPEVRARLAHELDTIGAMGFADYFLIQEEIVAWCHRQALAVGPGKGSGAGSLVGYLLGLSDVCPIQMTLCFERFLNPERPELPDVDLDVCWRRRDEALAHLAERHGQDRVARLGVVQSLRGRGALRLAGQALGLPPDLIDAVAKACGHHSLSSEFARNPNLKALPWQREPFARLKSVAMALEGLPDHVGLHPCGMALCPTTLSEVVPLMRAPDGQVMVQADKDTSEALGLLKVDILSNRGLTILSDAAALIQASLGVGLDPATLPTEDEEAFAFIATGRTYGINQLESRPVQAMLRQFQPTTLEDMTAITSLHRPGPINGGAKELYLRRRRGLEEAKIPECLVGVLGHTYGTVIFQEQVLMVAVVFAGFGLAEADLLRRELLWVGRRAGQAGADQEADALKQRFFEGARRKGHPDALIEEVYQLAVLGPSGYGFVKAHAAATQVIATRQAYLKARWPVHYLVAVLNTGMGYYPPRIYLEDARGFGARLLGPCVNRSGVAFSVEGQDPDFRPDPEGCPKLACGWLVRAGLGTITEVSTRGAEAIVRAREGGRDFASVGDFLRRVPLASDALANLVQAGALDAFGLSRPQLMLAIDRHTSAPKAVAGQASLFGPGDRPLPEWPLSGPDPDLRRSRAEALLGFPLARPPWVAQRQGLPLSQVGQQAPGTRVRFQAELVHVRKTHTKDGKKTLAFLLLSDGLHHVDAVAFPPAYEAYRQAFFRGDPLCWVGRMGGRKGDEGVVEVESVWELDGRPISRRGLPPSATPLPQGGFG